MPAGGPGGPGGAGAGPNMGFGGFDFSDFTRAAGSGSPRQPSTPIPANRRIFRISSASGSDGSMSRRTTAPEKGTDLEYGLSIDFWQAIRGTQVRLKINRQEVCATCNGTGRALRRQHGLPGMQRQRQRDADGGRDALQPHVSHAAKARGRLTNKCPTCHGDGRISHSETVEVRIPPGAQQGSRLRVAGQRQRGNARRAGGRSLHHRARRRSSVLPPRWRRHFDHRPGAHRRSGPGHQDRSAHHRRPRAAQDSAGDEERAEVPHARKGRAEFANRGPAAIRSSRSSLQAPEVHDERTKELLREYATLNPADPRAEIWSKV